MGRKSGKRNMVRCRRCSRRSFHIHKKRCSSCGYPSPKRRGYSWMKK